MTTVNAPAQNNGTATFEDGEAPLAAATETEEITDGQTAKAAPATAWALINLIAAIITVVIAAIVSILGLKKKDEDEDEEKEADRTNRKPLVRGLGVITAIVSVIAFILAAMSHRFFYASLNFVRILVSDIRLLFGHKELKETYARLSAKANTLMPNNQTK